MQRTLKITATVLVGIVVAGILAGVLGYIGDLNTRLDWLEREYYDYVECAERQSPAEDEGDEFPAWVEVLTDGIKVFDLDIVQNESGVSLDAHAEWE